MPGDGRAMQNYAETYGYDQVGNITSVVHAAAKGNWTRTYAYDQPATPPANNRLTSTTVGATLESYSYDPGGNVISMPQLAVMQWDWKNQLQVTAPLALSDAASQTTHYTYASSGESDQEDDRQPAERPGERPRLPGRIRSLPGVFASRCRHPRTPEPARI